MANSALLNLVGADNASPKQFTLQSPSFNKDVEIGTIIDYGDYTDTVPPQNVAGLQAIGYVKVQYHSDNQWKTPTYYTSQNGATLFGLIG